MNEMFIDGTFALAPPLFSQIFVLLARKGDQHGAVFPVLFCLLPNKTAPTYKRCFELIRQVWPTLNPTRFSVDYEITIHQALRQVFPDSRIDGCFFHLIKNLKKSLSENNLLGLFLIINIIPF